MTPGENISEVATDDGRRILGGRGRLVIIGVVLLLAVVYLAYSAFPGNASYFFTVDEFVDYSGNLEGETFRVKGKLEAGTFVREDGGTAATFSLTHGDGSIDAAYSGVVPDLFFNEHSEIILFGTYDNGEVFNVETVSVLCPSKYQALEELEQQADA